MAELESTLSEAELSEWIAFYQREPFGPEASFWRTGILASLTANIARDPKRKREPYTPADFMPASMQPPKPDPMDPKVVKAGLIAAFGARIKYVGDDQRIHDQGGRGDGAASEGTGA